MMDAKTKKELDRIQAAIPKNLSRDLITETVDNSEEELAREYLRQNRDIPQKQRYYIEQLIDSGAFRRSEKVENPKVIKELERFHSYRVEKARTQGKLSNPKNDAFLQKRLARMK